MLVDGPPTALVKSVEVKRLPQDLLGNKHGCLATSIVTHSRMIVNSPIHLHTAICYNLFSLQALYT